MRKRFGVAVVVLVTTSCIWASGALAATEIGSNCAANSAAANYTIVQLSLAGGAPVAAPAAGVVTKWKVNSALPVPPGFTLSERMRIFRSTGLPNEFQTVAESSPGSIQSGANTFETRIPVQAGDRIGAFAPASPSTSVLLCSSTNAEDKFGIKEGDVPPGGKATYSPVEKNQLALSVTIEPDADNDGFGDETQDKCPTSAAVQAVACPSLLIEAAALPPGKSLVRVLAASSIEANITASASATLPKTKKAKSSTTTALAPITQIVKPGQLAGFTLNFTGKLKRTLAALPKSKSVKLNVTVSGQNAAGAISTDTLTVKLKGQAKPKK
jgi:hypothetical protein